MIQNTRQYNVTKGQIAKLENALAAARDASPRVDPRVFKAMVAGIQSQIDELRQQLREFDELKDKDSLPVRSVEDLAQILIKARVARGYTQRDLADKVRLKAQQIQRYEASGYKSASLKRIADVMRALGLKLEANIPLRSS